MADSDKYPVESDRRRFVKGVVGSATLASVAVTGAVTVNSVTTPAGSGGGQTTYRGNERIGGPAPRGMPQIPIEIDDNGDLLGVWPEAEYEEGEGGQEIPVAEREYDVDGDTVTYSTTWFQFCGAQTSPAVDPEADRDNYIRYAENTQLNWQSELGKGGEPVNVNDFDDYDEFNNGIGDPEYGKPAQCTWRSEDLEPKDQLPVQLIRSPQIEQKAEDDEWLQQTAPEGFVANLNQCTHYCCVPGFRMYEAATNYDAENNIYCQCHQSIYDPFNIVEQQFVSLPRPGDTVGGEG